MIAKPLPCSCCPRPFAELVTLNNGQPALLIKSRHDSHIKHPNVLTLEHIKQMFAEFEAQEAVSIDKTLCSVL